VRFYIVYSKQIQIGNCVDDMLLLLKISELFLVGPVND